MTENTFYFYFRIVTLRDNKQIMSLEPNTFATDGGNILFVDAANNNFDTVDVTNILRKGFFCNLTFNSGYVGNITNTLGYNIKENGVQGPGDINLENCGMQSFINFPDYGLPFQDTNDYFYGSIYISQSSFSCDCKVYPFFALLDNSYVRKLWPNMESENSFICTAPERVKGMNLTAVLDSREFGQLTCDMDQCPYGCVCIDAPNDNKLIVDCSNSSLLDLPEFMPIGFNGNNNVELIMKNNKISRVSYRNYLLRLVALDLSGNHIGYFSDGVINTLDCDINIIDQKLERLSLEFQKKDPHMVQFGSHPVVCDCSNLWIGDWIRLNQAHGRLHCRLETGQTTEAANVDVDTLQCAITRLEWYSVMLPLICILLVLVVAIVMTYSFRFDVFLFIRKRTMNDINSEDKKRILHDVFISVCVDNDGAYDFFNTEILRVLKSRNYKIFEPNMDILPGFDRDTEVTNAVNRSAQYVVVFCKDYLVDHKALKELHDIMTAFVADSWRNLAVINFDGLESSDISIRRLRAANRSEFALDFQQTSSKLITRLLDKLQPPLKRNQTKHTTPATFMKNIHN